MAANTSLPIQLTSTAIASTATHYYSYEQQAVLFPHEPLRRELRRGALALAALALSLSLSRPDLTWKAKYLHVWLVELFIPMVLDHHDAEEKHMSPFYEKRGVKTPSSVDGDHAKLVTALEKIGTLSEALAESPSQEKLSALKVSYEAMSELMSRHLEEEEKFWPDAIKQVGEEEYNVFHKEMHTDMKNQPSGHMFIMSALDSMGYEFDGFSHVEGDTRWCGEQLLDDLIINKIPYFVRSWIFPPINRKYQYYKSLVVSVISGTEDNLPLKYEDGSYCSIC